MKYLKLFESKKAWELVFPNENIQWHGIESYLHDKTVVGFTPRDLRQIIQFIEPYTTRTFGNDV